MQVLWSRASQSRCTCRCWSCLTASPLTRRATTASAPARVNFGDIFTVFYSSIFATAAVADAKRKDDRRKRWDALIAEAKGHLPEDPSHTTNREGLDRSPCREKDNVGDEGKAPWPPPPPERLPEKLNSGFPKARAGRTVSQTQNHHTTRFRPLAKRYLAGAGLVPKFGGDGPAHPSRKPVSSEEDCTRTAIESATSSAITPQRLRDMEIMEISIAKMILHFEMYMANGGGVEAISTDQQCDPNLADKIYQLEELLRVYRRSRGSWGRKSPDWPSLPAYEVYRTSSESRSSLNPRLRKVLEVPSFSRDMLPKICELLSLSTAPPDVDTYNLLITYLLRFRQIKLVNVVLDSLNECPIQPNEVTVSSTLKFLILTRSRRRFQEFTGPPKGRWSRLVRDGPRNGHVMTAIINGTAKFDGAFRAMQMYVQLLQQGWKPNLAPLTCILRTCLLSDSWEDGYAVWGLMKETSNALSECITYRAYVWMLQLCRSCKQLDVYTDIVNELTYMGIPPSIYESWATDKNDRWIEDIKKMYWDMYEARLAALSTGLLPAYKLITFRLRRSEDGQEELAVPDAAETRPLNSPISEESCSESPADVHKDVDAGGVEHLCVSNASYV